MPLTLNSCIFYPISAATLIDRAIDLKQIEVLLAQIVDRVGEVLDNVRKNATKHALDPELTQTLWLELIEWSIQREAKQLDI